MFIGNKLRHRKSLFEKYGHDDVLSIVKETISEKQNKVDARELFNLLPRVGYLRVEANSEYGDAWYDTNDAWINAKVCKVDKERAHIVHYDSHHDDVVCISFEHSKYVVEGNVLRKK